MLAKLSTLRDLLTEAGTLQAARQSPMHGRPVVTILLTSTGNFQSLILAPSLENKIGKTHAPKVR